MQFCASCQLLIAKLWKTTLLSSDPPTPQSLQQTKIKSRLFSPFYYICICSEMNDFEGEKRGCGRTPRRDTSKYEINTLYFYFFDALPNSPNWMSTSLGDIQILTDILKDKTVIELGITSIEQKWSLSSSGKRKKKSVF